jgi:hypothetical protein
LLEVRQRSVQSEKSFDHQRVVGDDTAQTVGWSMDGVPKDAARFYKFHAHFCLDAIVVGQVF